MENLDDSEKNAKISDSAYSNSCSNSQSRRSHSSKSTHSGSNSSGSSGYRGKPSTGSSDAFSQPPEKRAKSSKKKKQPQAEPIVADPPKEVETSPEVPQENEVEMNPVVESEDVAIPPVVTMPPKEQFAENIEISVPEQAPAQEEITQALVPRTSSPVLLGRASTCCPVKVIRNYRPINTVQLAKTYSPAHCHDTESVITPFSDKDGFSCVISMHDGVVMYTTSSITSAIGFPKDLWIGRSFIEFVHPKDRNTFASQITNELVSPKTTNDQTASASGMFCRIRRFRSLGNTSFGVKDKIVVYTPFYLTIFFKDINEDDAKVIYLVIQAKPILPEYKMSTEIIIKPVPFILRHVSNGSVEYIDHKAVPYLGYLPQDILNKCILQLYHPDDLVYLKQIYKTIVKEGKSQRSKAYRMLAQNGDYVKVETEWSSFINPWSKKLEFVIGKHYVIEGPNNPDVFMVPITENKPKNNDEQKTKTQQIKDDMIRIMNEVLTKPAENAKQHMSERCQDLAKFMETLVEEQPKVENDLRIDIHDPDTSYYERDSLMLGGISPHHDNDSQSGTETPLSYNQLNYNENLQRYFDRHEIVDYPLERYPRENGTPVGKSSSPLAIQSGESGDRPSLRSGLVLMTGPLLDLISTRPAKLTEDLLNKHNSEMEKDLVKKHRETRMSTKSEREKILNETRQKNKEHLARCSASYLPVLHKEIEPHGIKRSCRQIDNETYKHKPQCTISKQARKNTTSNNNINSGNNSSTAVSTWVTPPLPGMHSHGQPLPSLNQPVPIVSPVPAVPAGMIPVYYVPTPAPPTDNHNLNNQSQYPGAVPYMVYPQPVFGSPFVYSPVNAQATFPMSTQNCSTEALSTVRYTSTQTPLVLTNSNYEQACTPSPSMKNWTVNRGLSLWREKKLKNVSNTKFAKAYQTSSTSSSANANKDFDKNNRKGCPEETTYRTDGESSYSSFYSSFFKTESGSLEDSFDRTNRSDSASKRRSEGMNMSFDQNDSSTSAKRYSPNEHNFFPKRNINPPWMDQVNVTPELIYKYQIVNRNKDEVLQSDMQKMSTMQQPSLVNEQLDQLYLDLQLEGVASRLTLEEGITSSASSADEAVAATAGEKRKKEYSKLVMIYEEDAPLPPPDSDSSVGPSPDEPTQK